jgi:protein-S-isoprenylcysteine O-methyltransferase Ste14
VPDVTDETPDGGPRFRLWPPVSVGVPLVAGLVLSGAAGDPWASSTVATVLGWALLAVFAGWNGWALVTMARHGTGLLPGQPSTTVLDRGPFAWSRNPLYVGLLVASAGVALLASSLWAVVALPVEWALLRWGAILPEERYLAAKFGDDYTGYRARVRRWL